MFIFFEDDDTGALAHDKAVAVAVIGPGSSARLVVKRRTQGAASDKAGNTNRDDGRFSPPGDHDIGGTIFDETCRIANGMSPGRARRYHSVVRTFETVADRNLARGEINE